MKNILYFLSCVIKPKYTKQPTPQINARYLEPLRTDGEQWGFKFIFDYRKPIKKDEQYE